MRATEVLQKCLGDALNMHPEQALATAYHLLGRDRQLTLPIRGSPVIQADGSAAA